MFMSDELVVNIWNDDWANPEIVLVGRDGTLVGWIHYCEAGCCHDDEETKLKARQALGIITLTFKDVPCCTGGNIGSQP